MSSVDMYGEFLSNIGKLQLNFDYSNLALITVDGGDFPALVSSYSVNRSERIQLVPTFNDFVHLYAFGKQPIQIVLSGFAPSDDDKVNLQALIEKYESKYRAFNAASGGFMEITSLRGESLQGLCTNFTYTANAEMPVLVNFNMNIIGLGQNDTVLAGSISTGTTGGGEGGRNNVPAVGRS